MGIGADARRRPEQRHRAQCPAGERVGEMVVVARREGDAPKAGPGGVEKGREPVGESGCRLPARGGGDARRRRELLEHCVAHRVGAPRDDEMGGAERAQRGLCRRR